MSAADKQHQNKANQEDSGEYLAAEKNDSAKAADGKAKVEEPHDPQVEEAVEVLADLVALTHRGGAEAVARGGQ